MIYYKLDKQLSSEKIIKDIQNLINSESSTNLSNKILVVKIQSATDYNGDSPLPKLPYYEEKNQEDQIQA